MVPKGMKSRTVGHDLLQELLEERREDGKKKRTMYSVADDIGCHRSAILRWLKEHHRPRTILALKLEELYEIPVASWAVEVAAT